MKDEVNVQFNEKINKLVFYGNVWLALEISYICVAELASWLKDYPFEANSDNVNDILVAYRAVCAYDLKLAETLSGKCAEFAWIYRLSSPLESLKKCSLENEIKKPNNLYNLYIISDRLPPMKEPLSDDKNELLLKSRSHILLIGSFNNDESYPIFSVKHDYIEMLRLYNINVYLPRIFERASFLREKAIDYFEFVFLPTYSSFLRDNLIFEKLSYADAKKVMDIFPDTLPEGMAKILRLTTYPALIYNLKYRLTMEQRAYVLGFPIHLGNPSEEQVDSAIDKLRDIGIDNYSNYIYERNKKYINNCLPHWNDNDQIANFENMLKDKVFEYNLIDTIFYKNNKHVYVFNRPEFVYIIRERLNIYTNLPIPEQIYKTAFIRLHLGQSLNLPCPLTILEMLEITESDDMKKLFEKQKERTVLSLTPETFIESDAITIGRIMYEEDKDSDSEEDEGDDE